MPPATSSMGAERSIEVCTTGSELHAAVNTCRADKLVLKIQIILKGKTPLIKNTAINIPQVRNHLRALAPIVDNISAFIIALSTEEIASKTESPMIVKIAPSII